MVQVDIGRLRLVSQQDGSYAIHEMALRGPESKDEGKLYVKRRHYGMTLDAALRRLIETLPQHRGPVRTLAQLRLEVQRAKNLLAALLLDGPDGPQLVGLPARCSICGKFFSKRDIQSGIASYYIEDSRMLACCPRCHTEEVPDAVG